MDFIWNFFESITGSLKLTTDESLFKLASVSLWFRVLIAL